jgi:hypothetical protein
MIAGSVEVRRLHVIRTGNRLIEIGGSAEHRRKFGPCSRQQGDAARYRRDEVASSYRCKRGQEEDAPRSRAYRERGVHDPPQHAVRVDQDMSKRRAVIYG